MHDTIALLALPYSHLALPDSFPTNKKADQHFY